MRRTLAVLTLTAGLLATGCTSSAPSPDQPPDAAGPVFEGVTGLDWSRSQPTAFAESGGVHALAVAAGRIWALANREGEPVLLSSRDAQTWERVDLSGVEILPGNEIVPFFVAEPDRITVVFRNHRTTLADKEEPDAAPSLLIGVREGADISWRAVPGAEFGPWRLNTGGLEMWPNTPVGGAWVDDTLVMMTGVLWKPPGDGNVVGATGHAWGVTRYREAGSDRYADAAAPLGTRAYHGTQSWSADNGHTGVFALDGTVHVIGGSTEQPGSLHRWWSADRGSSWSVDRYAAPADGLLAIHQLATGPDGIVAVGDLGRGGEDVGLIAHSVDGTDWQLQTVPEVGSLDFVVADSTGWYAIAGYDTKMPGSQNSRIFQSVDGVEWTEIPSVTLSDRIIAAVSIDDVLVLATATELYFSGALPPLAID